MTQADFINVRASAKNRKLYILQNSPMIALSRNSGVYWYHPAAVLRSAMECAMSCLVGNGSDDWHRADDSSEIGDGVC